MKERVKKSLWLSLIGIGLFVTLLVFLNIFFPLNITIRYSTTIQASDGTVLYAFLSPDDKWRMKTELDEIIPELKKAIIAKEDQYFYYHFGVNPIAIVRAVFNNLMHLKKTSGASTITMQVARLLEPKPRTYANKCIELFRALQLEWYYSKEEILQLYLNLVPYGGNLEGVKSASVFYFNKSPNHLSLAQAVALTIIPNRPTSLRLGKNNTLLQQERNRWLSTFQSLSLFPAQQLKDAIAEPLSARRQATPRALPHLALLLKNKYPDEANVNTYIRKDIQSNVADLLYAYTQRTASRHIYNASAIVIDNKTHSVIAYVGSQNFQDQLHGGEVNGLRALRSPGSTLKPFVYGLGFDKGLYTPKSVLTDVPTNFDGFEPENFDRRFNGKVSVEKALAYSLNIPAVKALEQVGMYHFIQLLKKAGLKNIKKNEHRLGFSLILGGCGVTLEELSNLYSSLANEGKIYPLQFVIADSAKKNGVQLLSPAAAFMLSTILTQIERPDLPSRSESAIHIPKIAWKTGTSYGRRDAWSIGYNQRYTIGIWVGNFSGEGVPELTGADIATPLLFEVFNTIDYNSSAQWFRKPSQVGLRFVCPETGCIPEDFCEQPVMDFFIQGISSAQQCEHLKYVWVSPDEKMSYCVSCLPDRGVKKKMYPNLAPEMIDFYHSQNTAYLAIPSHNPYCTRLSEEGAIQIVSPRHGADLMVDKEEPAELLLKCHTRNDVKRICWYVNDVFFKSGLPTERFFYRFAAGENRISCSDDKGRTAKIKIIVRYQ